MPLMKTKITKKQLTRDYMTIFERADEMLLEHKDGYFYPDFDELEKTLEELSGQSFYKRWDRPAPKEVKLSKQLGHLTVKQKQNGKNINPFDKICNCFARLPLIFEFIFYFSE